MMCLPFTHRWKIREKTTMPVFSSIKLDGPPIRHKVTILMECIKCGWVKPIKFEL
jgi:hypothetical protein